MNQSNWSLGDTEKEDTAVILYDGYCNLCTGSARFIIKRDPKAYFRFVPLQSETGKRYVENYGLSNKNLDTLILIEKGKVYIKSTVVLKIAARLSTPWSLIKIFLFVPSGIRDWVYDRIARSRIRWFGSSDVCWFPPGAREEERNL